MIKMKDSGYSYIGLIPTNWEVTRNKNVFSCNKILVGSNSNSTQLLSLTTKGVKEKDINNPEGKLPESFDTYQYVKENDIVMCLFDLDVSAVFSGISPYNGMISPAYKVLTCKNNIVPQFADYWFKYISDGRKFNHYAKNIRYTLNYEDFSSLPIVFPPLETQQRITDYLDEKCKKIDTIIEKQQSVIEKLKEYKLSVITEAVTKGLNPDVEMKDSGIEWIGKIPMHWKLPKIKYLTQIGSGGTPDRNNIKYWNGNINWFKTGELQNNYLYESEEKITNLGLENSSAKIFPENTILMAMYGQGKTRGMTALLKKNGSTNQACAGIIVTNEKISVDFLWKFLMGSYNAIREEAIGSGQPNLSASLINNFSITLPPLPEQLQICAFIDKKIPIINDSILKKQILIDKLTEYKKSLIYEVVTGKKEV